jgi:AcrR family transcriptional regulator
MSFTDITLARMMSVDDMRSYNGVMGRWEPNAGNRLQKAAMELYAEQGFENTTVAEIAERAGLSERTFFRHFTDKREVLFAGAGELQRFLVDAVASAPQSCPPIVAVASAFEATGAFFDDRRTGAQLRQAVINANPELQERELIKLASMASALAQALRERGVHEPTATLASEAGVVAFRVAFDNWVQPMNTRDLADVIRQAFSQLVDVTSAK